MRTYNLGGFSHEKTYFPFNSALEEAVLIFLKELDGEAATEQINQKVIEILNLSDEIVQMEDESGLGTKLNIVCVGVERISNHAVKLKILSEALGLWIK